MAGAFILQGSTWQEHVILILVWYERVLLPCTESIVWRHKPVQYTSIPPLVCTPETAFLHKQSHQILRLQNNLGSLLCEADKKKLQVHGFPYLAASWEGQPKVLPDVLSAARLSDIVLLPWYSSRSDCVWVLWLSRGRWASVSTQSNEKNNQNKGRKGNE